MTVTQSTPLQSFKKCICPQPQQHLHFTGAAETPRLGRVLFSSPSPLYPSLLNQGQMNDTMQPRTVREFQESLPGAALQRKY